MRAGPQVRKFAALAIAIAALFAGCTPEIAEDTTPLPVRVGGVEMLSMTERRALHTAVVMHDGHVLICGGTVNAEIGGVLASAEIYDPVSRTFTRTGAMAYARQGHTATVLDNGLVLIAGGAANIGFRSEMASAELYDPATGTFRPTGSMHTAREGHTATLLRDGRVLIAGGSPNGLNTTDSAEIYNPRTGLFTAIAPMTVPREAHSATLLRNGKVLIAGGGRGGMPGGYIAYATAEVFDPLTNTFTALAAHMVYDRVGHAAALLRDGRVLLAGGKSSKVRTGGLAGGTLFWLAPLDSAEVFDPESNTFREVGRMRKPHYLGVASVLEDGMVLVTGGWAVHGPVVSGMATAELFDPISDTFVPVGRLHIARLNQTATTLRDGQVMVAGGIDGESQVTATVEFYLPASRRFTVRPGQKYERHHPEAE